MADILTLPELAKYLKTSRDTIYRKAQKGMIPAVKFGKEWRFAYSGDIGHRFRLIPAIRSGSFRPAVPGDSGHPVGAERRWSENIFDRKIRPSQALISFS
jgi:excisionase family DNA binding protein